VPETHVREVDLPSILAPWCERHDVELVVDIVDSLPGMLDLAGFMLHHDVSGAGQLREVTTRRIHEGRPDLAGPLANLHVPRNEDPDRSTIIVTALGRAHDSGTGDPRVLAAVRNDAFAPAPNDRKEIPGSRKDGTPFFLDVEVANTGTGEEYQPGQIHATIVAAAAVCAHFGWNPRTRVKHHREWTRRKIDMSYHGDLLGPIEQLIAAGLTGEVEIGDTEEEDVAPKVTVDASTATATIEDWFRKVAQREADQAGLVFWTGELLNENRTVGEVFKAFCEAVEQKP
jgi:N-acetylmuramoyl-L-alanine amidase